MRKEIRASSTRLKSGASARKNSVITFILPMALGLAVVILVAFPEALVISIFGAYNEKYSPSRFLLKYVCAPITIILGTIADLIFKTFQIPISWICRKIYHACRTLIIVLRGRVCKSKKIKIIK